MRRGRGAAGGGGRAGATQTSRDDATSLLSGPPPPHASPTSPRLKIASSIAGFYPWRSTLPHQPPPGGGEGGHHVLTLPSNPSSLSSSSRPPHLCATSSSTSSGWWEHSHGVLQRHHSAVPLALRGAEASACPALRPPRGTRRRRWDPRGWRREQSMAGEQQGGGHQTGGWIKGRRGDARGEGLEGREERREMEDKGRCGVRWR